MPLLEIHKGGFVQIDLYNRMLISNSYKFQKAIETQNFAELQLNEREPTADDDTTVVDGKENSTAIKHKVPVVNSFFPFSYTDDDDVDSSNLNEILLYNSMSEGSVLDIEL